MGNKTIHCFYAIHAPRQSRFAGSVHLIVGFRPLFDSHLLYHSDVPDLLSLWVGQQRNPCLEPSEMLFLAPIGSRRGTGHRQTPVQPPASRTRFSGPGLGAKTRCEQDSVSSSAAEGIAVAEGRPAKCPVFLGPSTGVSSPVQHRRVGHGAILPKPGMRLT